MDRYDAAVMGKQAQKSYGPENWSEYAAPGVVSRESRIMLSTNISLRVISFYPKSGAHLMPVVMLPGLVSVMYSFKHAVKEFTKYYVLHWVESREKSSSIVPDGASFDIGSLGSDIADMVAQLGCEDRRYILAGASLNGTAMVHRYPVMRKKPFCMVLLEPNAVFDYPSWSLFAIRISLSIDQLKNRILGSYDQNSSQKTVLKYFGKWYLKNFRMNLKEDYEMLINSKRPFWQFQVTRSGTISVK